MKKLRKFLTVSVMVLSIIAMSGLTAVSSAKAAASTGDLIKMAGNTSVYYLNSDGKRYVFPNSTTYFSWYPDFSGVITIPASELQSYPIGGNVTMRAGTKLVKITTDPKVYAVEPNGVLRGIQTEAQAAALYGTNWNKRVVDVPDAFFTNYTTGTALATGATPAGSIVKNAGSASVYYYDGTNYRTIASEAAFNANRFQWANVLTLSGSIAAGGTAVSSAEFTNVAQSGSATVITGSGLMVSLSASTPAAISVPQNGARVPMAKVNLTAANDGAVSVNSITVNRIGLSTYSQVVNVWAEKDGVIVASKKSMNSNDQSILTFSPALVVPAGQTVSIDLVASLTGASGNIGLSIANAAAISATSASVSGSFPINGNLMSPAAYDVVNVKISDVATATTLSVKVGDEKAELGHFTLGFPGTGKDVSLRSIMLKNNGVEDLSTASMNLYLEQAGNKVSVNTVVSGRYVTFYFPSAGLDLLKDDSSKIFYIKGDVISKQNTATSSFAFVLNKSTDLVAYEKATGFGTNVFDATGVAADNYAISNVTVTAGAISVSKKSTSPSDTTIIKGSDNLMLLANIRADEIITADGIKLTYSSAGTGDYASTTDQFENVRVYLNGVLLDSFDATSSLTGVVTKTITSALTLNKGDNELKIMAKAEASASNASAIRFKLDGATIFSSQNPTYSASNNVVAAADINGTATGGIFTVSGATLTTVRNDGYATNKVVVEGSTDVSVAKFTLKASNDDVKVTSIAFGANASSTPAANVYDFKLYVDGAQVGTVVDFGSTGATFSSLNFIVAKDSTKTVEVKGSFDSSAAGTASASTTGFQTVMTVNAQDSRGTAITGGSGITIATSTILSVVAAGSLNVDLGGNTPAAAMLASKPGVEQEVAQFKFTAVNDSANLTEINVINTNYASTTIASTSVAEATADARIAAIKLYDGATLIDSFVPVNGAGKFTITTGKINIAANTSKTLSVKVVLNNIDNDAAATNKDIHLGITTLKFKSSAGAESTQAAGTSGNGTLANNFRIRKTVPTVALLALPTTVLTAGDNVVSKFTVTADSNGDVALRKIVLDFSRSTNATLTALAVGSAVKVNGSFKTVATSSIASASLATSTLTIRFVTDEVITAGTSKTFEILGTTAVSGNGSESITTKISEEASYVTDSVGETGNFVWSDGASVSTATYSNSTRVPGLTTQTQVLSK